MCIQPVMMTSIDGEAISVKKLMIGEIINKIDKLNQ